MIELIFNFICLTLVCLCLWRMADISHRLEMNIMVVQSLQSRIDKLEDISNDNSKTDN